MRAIVQRVASASVTVGPREIAKIGPGLVLLVGVRQGDSPASSEWLADKVGHLRIFPDDANEFDRSILDVSGSILLVSQFTVYGDCRKGRRPNFSTAAPATQASPLFDKLATDFRDLGLLVETGEFGAMMQVLLTNDGPVTLVVDTPERFNK